MHRTDRLLGILLFLQSRRRATGAELAAHFEVSRRTILRDVETLSAMGVPVEAESGPGGGFRLMQGYFLPPLVFRTEEAWALLTSLQALLAHGGVPHRGALTQAADKVAAVLDARTRSAAERMAKRVGLHVWAVDPGPWLDTLSEAVVQGEGLQITYHGPDGLQERQIDPYLLYSQGGFWFVQAYCHLRAGIRIFRTDRIGDLKPTGRRFPPPASVDVAEPFAYRRRGEKPNVRVRCTPEAARRVADHPEWAAHLNAEGEICTWIPPAQFPYFARVLLGFGPGATVVEPAELREMLVGLAQAVVAAQGEQTPGAKNGDTTVSPALL